MATEQTLRIVNKARYDEQTFLSIPAPTTPLAPSSVRVHVVLLGLTSNNLSYCAAGDFLHWYKAFPLPSATPAPYNDPTKYGIGTGWGFFRVTESTISAIPSGRFLSGFIPISGHTVDLRLRQVEHVPEDFIETSPHRKEVSNLYQRFTLLPEGFVPNPIDPHIAKSTVIKLFGSGHMLANYVFAQNDVPIHPLGHPISPWTNKEADLTGACIVPIASGTKTCKAFLYSLSPLAREGKAGYSVIEVTSGTGCERYIKVPPFPHSTVKYSEITPAAFGKHRKYIVLNFGGRGDSFIHTFEAIKQSNPEAEVICIQIGGEPKIWSKEELMARMAVTASINALQMNATGIQDVAMEREGEKEFFEKREKAYDAMIKDQVDHFDGKILGVTLKAFKGLRGEEGVEGLWKNLATGQFDGDEGWVVELDE